jgi:hypothetical protein
MLKKILAFSSVVEVATGLALLIDPRFVVALLVGPKLPVEEIPMGRLPGIAILALGVACWPSRRDATSGSPAFRGMLVYNALIALFLVYLFKVGHLGGMLLWPAVALHAVVAVLLIWTWHAEEQQ